jgi:hypothetical protein
VPQTAATHKTGGSMARRAESVADRIEESAAGLAAFAEGLSEAEWRTRAREGVNLDFSWPEAGDFHPSRLLRQNC